MLFTSSSMVYGNFKDGEVDENSKCDPIGIYGNFKLSRNDVEIIQTAFLICLIRSLDHPLYMVEMCK